VELIECGTKSYLQNPKLRDIFGDIDVDGRGLG
jgi:hypothetical protein